MAIMIAAYDFYFAKPWWLLACALIVPAIWIAWANLASLGNVRRYVAIGLRCLVIFLLAAMLARPKLAEENQTLAVMAVIDHSSSVPEALKNASFDYLDEVLAKKEAENMLAVVDIAEMASISRLPSRDTEIRRRNTTLNGSASDLAKGLQMAMAISPADTATRILLVSDGNETSGDLKEAARIAAANGIPIDVLPLRYNYEHEVIFKKLATPVQARSGQTVSLRFVLSSTAKASGKIVLTCNGKAVILDPENENIAANIELTPGTNVKTISLPVGTRGMHDYEAVFIPDDESQDMIVQNNKATAITYVSGPGHVLVCDADGKSGTYLLNMLNSSDIEAQYLPVDSFPDKLTQLMDTDAVVLVNIDCSNFSYQQQEMIVKYVNELGGGLVMIGGDNSFGAGGWIGSPVADILPVDLDPPQKKQLPKGALMLIMHACEIPQGNYWGKRIAKEAVKTLSRLDYAGVLAYSYNGDGDWVYPFSQVDDKKKINAAIDNMVMGDMPSLHDLAQQAYDKLKTSDAAQKHVIVISDGDPAPPTGALLDLCKKEGITITGIGINPHSPNDVNSLKYVAQKTGGRFYHVKNPNDLPKIFIKEAQVIKRALIIEEPFIPQITYSLNEITKGLPSPLPKLDGYIFTGPKSGLSQVIFVSDKSDPILATCQSGLGRCVAFTSSIDSRWGSSWLGWPSNERFWEQVTRWACKSSSSKSSDCDAYVEINGQEVSLNVEAIDSDGSFIQLANIDGRVITPDFNTSNMKLSQNGPGEYSGKFKANGPGSYIINLQYRKIGDKEPRLTQIPVSVPFAPEFRELSDNSALLKEICDISGGRLLDVPWEAGDDFDKVLDEANLYDTANIKFPQSELSIARYLMYAWLVLFLLDIAVRRVSLNIIAMIRKLYLKMAKLLMPKHKSEENINKLKEVREKIKKDYTKRSESEFSAKRYQADTTTEIEMPKNIEEPEKEAKLSQPEKKEKPVKDNAKEDGTDTDQSHINKLLKAKRKFTDNYKEKDEK
ncbi:MAG: VWA domain-containing protein [Phycisphaerae bacterium]|nr:VWA domain-containing protein [Phycisphaerae bacterium]